MLSHHSLIHPILVLASIENAIQLPDYLLSRPRLSRLIWAGKTYLTTVLQTIRRAPMKLMLILIHPRQIHSFHSLRHVPEDTGDDIPLHRSPHPPGTPTWIRCLHAACTRLKCPTRSSSLLSAPTPPFLQSSPSTLLSPMVPSRQGPTTSLRASASIRGFTPTGWMISQPSQNILRPIPSQMPSA